MGTQTKNFGPGYTPPKECQPSESGKELTADEKRVQKALINLATAIVLFVPFPIFLFFSPLLWERLPEWVFVDPEHTELKDGPHAAIGITLCAYAAFVLSFLIVGLVGLAPELDRFFNDKKSK